MENWIFFIIVIVVAVLLGLGVMYFGRRRSSLSPKEKAFFSQQWQKIRSEKNSHTAILEADKLLDLALKKKGYQGSLGEKLKKSAKLFSDLNEIWWAHKLRNRIAHELDVKITEHEIKKALACFQRGLCDLQVFP